MKLKYLCQQHFANKNIKRTSTKIDFNKYVVNLMIKWHSWGNVAKIFNSLLGWGGMERGVGNILNTYLENYELFVVA